MTMSSAMQKKANKKKKDKNYKLLHNDGSSSSGLGVRFTDGKNLIFASPAREKLAKLDVHLVLLLMY